MKIENQFWFLEEISWEENLNREERLYYDFNKKAWVKEDEYTGYWVPARFPCRSYRAARRHLRKHNEIPKGTKFRLCSSLIGGFDRYLVK